MIYYFSGLHGEREADMLCEAGITRGMVDPFVYSDVAEHWPYELVLDSGAYRIWKDELDYTVDDYAAFLEEHADRFTWATSLDVIGDPQQSLDNYVRLTHDGFGVVPVWAWQSDRSFLHHYLDNAEVVGIGGLVPLMRDRDERMLNELRELCEAHPKRFHIFGLSWPKAIDRLHGDGTVLSADSSHWLAAARKGLVMFEHSRGYFTHAPYRVLPFAKDLDRRGRCVFSARNLRDFIAQPAA